mmetsp:Transcript_51611/g.105058  ORF Transcript_51611/g.105058 Transcript_51611/m.105058 type:complete len:294 (-) Transcript_51611:110-991(-)
MSFQQLNKFQARMIRRQGDAVFKALRANNPLILHKGKHTEKDVREQAKKTAVQVFKSLNFWDDEEDIANPECTVTFEQYLAAVFNAKIKGPDKANYNAATAGLKGILRIERVEDKGKNEDLSEDEGDEENWPERTTRLKFVDNPSAEQLESEWQQRQSLEKLELDAGEAAALKMNISDVDMDRVSEVIEAAQESEEEPSQAEAEPTEEQEAPHNPIEPAMAEPATQSVDPVSDASPQPEACVVPAAETSASNALAKVWVYPLSEDEVRYKQTSIQKVRKAVNHTRESHGNQGI